ncbi:MAG: N-acetylmuramoyl-L-alanine amidase [Eubacteriaceae bacterium]|nr:N-acetylmuramoyl-L-alanine amidase [Eubacteriaceae bacterium]
MNKKKRSKKIMCLLLAMCVAVAMIPTLAFADEQAAADQNGQATDTQSTEQTQTDTQKTEKAAAAKATNYTVTATRSDKIKYMWGGYVTSIVPGKTSSGEKTYTSKQTFTIKTYDGFTLDKVLVDGKENADALKAKSYTFEEGTTGDHTISAVYKRTGVFIKIDPGHAGNYNRGYYSSFWESKQMWDLGRDLRDQLEKYPNVVVSLTKTSLNNDPAVYTRGKMAKGYDLFISCHSNSSSSKSTDYALSIVSSGSTLRSVAAPLGKQLAATMKTTMGTKQNYQVWIKKQHDGRDWFGVVRGSAAVKVPGMILEHSFHSNARSCNWLLSSSNLNKMAAKEAAVITDYYGVNNNGSVDKPGKPSGFNAYGYGYKSAKIKWNQSAGATGYNVYRADSKTGKYEKIKTINNSSTVYYIDSDLTCGKVYYYKVKAFRYRTEGSALYSSSTSPNAAKPIPSKPKLGLTAGNNKITAKWSAVSGATGYQLYRASSKRGKYKRVKTTKARYYKNSRLANKKRYYYKVRAYRTLDNGTHIYGNFCSVKYKTTK